MLSAEQLAKLPREKLEQLYAKAFIGRARKEQQQRHHASQLQARGLNKLVNNRPAFFKEVLKQLPQKFSKIFDDYTFKIARGGRGSAKSVSVAKAIIAYMVTGRERVLCTRQYQNSIKDSVHQDLKQQIEQMGLNEHFIVTKDGIACKKTGSEALFKGMQHPDELKSTSGITITWVEEGQTLIQDSFDAYLLPTVLRMPNSQVFITYNQENENDPVDVFTANPPPRTLIIDVNWQDNPWFPPLLNELREHALSIAEESGDWSAYNWIWEGKYRELSEAIVFWRRVVVEDFDDEPPAGTMLFHGADWGFAVDPTALIRCYITDEVDGAHLWIDREAYGWRTDFDELPDLFDEIETSRRWRIYADAARPETIHYMKQKQFNIMAAEKWKNSVEEGISYLKGFKKIHIHKSNCPNITEEAKLYSYKQDPKTKKVSPVLVDAYNHGWDAVRYALVDYIRGKVPMYISAKAMAASKMKVRGRIGV